MPRFRSSKRWEGRGPSAALVCAVMALVSINGCGDGDGGGGSRTVTLDGTAAVEASVGVGLSTGIALSTLFLDLELSIEESMSAPAARARVDAGGGAGVAELECDLGGSQSTACEVDRRGRTTIDLEFSDCRSAFDGGRQRRRDGHVRLIVGDPLVCVTGTLRDGVPFSLRFDGFRSRIVDDEGRELGAFTANLTEDVLLAPGGCLTSDGSRSANGSLDIEIADRGVDLSLEATDLRFEVESVGSPCEQAVVVSGSMRVDDRANRLRFSQVLDDTEVTLAANGQELLVGIDGEIDNDCLGNLQLFTAEPISLTRVSGCPQVGSFALVLDGGISSTVDFQSGGVDFDFDDDGSIDNSVASCRDASLARCAAR